MVHLKSSGINRGEMLCMNESFMPRTNAVNQVWRSTFPVHILGETNAFTSYPVYRLLRCALAGSQRLMRKKQHGFFIKMKIDIQICALGVHHVIWKTFPK